MKSAIRTKHNLAFEVSCIPWAIDPPIFCFRVGTCHGQYTVNDHSFVIISIVNDKKGNGHFEDVLEWFEYACRRDLRMLMIVAIMNERFKHHLLGKRGFDPVPYVDDAVVKIFEDESIPSIPPAR